MARETIFGRPPAESGPEPAAADTDGRAADTDGQPTEVPGDPTTAFHRGRLYSLLAIGFDRPGESFQEAVDAGAFGDDLVDSAAIVGDLVAEAASAVASTVDDADVLHGPWASLFGVEEGVTVSPYELTYLPGPLVTNVRDLADICGFYEAFGLEVAPEKNDRRDHLCFLLEFLGQLSLREAYLRTEGDDEGVAVVVDAYRQFVEAHLGRWYWRFGDEVRDHGTGFYAALADLLEALLDEEVDRLGGDPDPVPEDPMAAEWTEDVFGDSGRGCGGCGVTPSAVDGRCATVPGTDETPDGRAEQ